MHRLAQPAHAIPAGMQRCSGFTLIEVTVSSLVLLIGFALGFAAFGEAETRTANALRERDASMLAGQIRDRLLSLSPTLNGCPGAAPDPLRDVNSGNSLNCVGSDATGAGGVTCRPDHPIDATEFLTAIAQDGVGRGYSAAYDAGAGVGTLMYRGAPYRVAWNVDCGTPASDMRYSRLLVMWPPFEDAIGDGRFLRFDFVKGSGL